MKKIGAFVGKFYPPHIGHLSVVDNALKEFDKIYIIISKNEIREKEICSKQNFNPIDVELIKNWFSEHYKNEPKIFVEIFDENGLLPYPQDLANWTKKFKEQFSDVNYKIADSEYREFNEKYFPEYNFYEIDREVIPVHSTILRANIKENIKYVIPEAKDYFAKIQE